MQLSDRPFTIALLEDDPIQAEWVAEEMVRRHAPDAQILYYDSEYSFTQAFDTTLKEHKPHLFILDMMVRYYSPTDLAEMNMPPKFDGHPSPSRAGLRIAQQLRGAIFADTPIVLWTVLDDPRPSLDSAVSDVLYLNKGDENAPERLMRTIRSVAAAYHSPLPPLRDSKRDLQITSGFKLFYSYSHKDEGLREQLQTHLALLKRQGVILEWHDRCISAGREWEGQIDHHLKSARIILLLVSADFLASDYCYDIEIRSAMALHETGDVRVIPVILRACDWHQAPFGKLQAVPKNGSPVTSAQNIDEAFTDVAKSIRAATAEIRTG